MAKRMGGGEKQEEEKKRKRKGMLVTSKVLTLQAVKEGGEERRGRDAKGKEGKRKRKREKEKDQTPHKGYPCTSTYCYLAQVLAVEANEDFSFSQQLKPNVEEFHSSIHASINSSAREDHVLGSISAYSRPKWLIIDPRHIFFENLGYPFGHISSLVFLPNQACIWGSCSLERKSVSESQEDGSPAMQDCFFQNLKQRKLADPEDPTH